MTPTLPFAAIRAPCRGLWAPLLLALAGCSLPTVQRSPGGAPEARFESLARSFDHKAPPAPAPTAASTSAQATRPAAPAAPVPDPTMLPGPAFQKTVSLEFREAPLRQVFEALARSSTINFVFDKDVKTDTRVTVFLRGVSLDEAMRVILATQQLDRKLLNDNTLLIFPNNAAKQREHQELLTRVIYLTNADPKAAMALVRTMAKTRDVVVDERLNALVVRDTPEVVRQIERLLAAMDLPEPEVTLAIEVLEVSTERMNELGINWPASIGFGLPGAATAVDSGSAGLRGLAANPLLAASLRGTTGDARILANPMVRARNREKAKVQIGEKLPVFSTTAVANAGVSASVSYIDVGLKLDIEPSVQLDGEVIIKLGLEVSNLVGEVRGPSGSASLAYVVGTRQTTTSLRLKDGQTQVLAGLINDQDRHATDGLPGLSDWPLVGRLFGVTQDKRTKTEIVMLITPRIVRNLDRPADADLRIPSGTDSLPGATPLRVAPSARVGMAPGRSGPAGGQAVAAVEPVAAEPGGALQLSGSAEARVGQTVAVTLANRSGQKASGELVFDPTLLQPASAGASTGTTTSGRLPFVLDPQGERAVILRVLPAAAGLSISVQASANVAVEGDVQLRVPAAEAGR